MCPAIVFEKDSCNINRLEEGYIMVLPHITNHLPASTHDTVELKYSEISRSASF